MDAQEDLSTIVKIGHLVGSLVMAGMIASLLIHLPVTVLALVFGIENPAVQIIALIADLIFIIVATREFFRNYSEWFEPI